MRALLAFLFLGCSSVLGVAHAKIVGEIIKVPVAVKDIYGKEVTQEIVVTVWMEDTTPSPRPIMVINHGREAAPEKRRALGRVAFRVNSTWFAQIGFLVAVPTRVGYGISGGEDVEGSGNCNSRNYPPVFKAAADQTLRVLETLRQRPDAMKDHAVVVGQSFGGATSIAVAARNPPGVQATINFSGGGGGNSQTHPQNPCSTAYLKRLFANYGTTSRIPTLWVYTENDQWMGPKYPQEWFDVFVQEGGLGEFVFYPPFGKDGHFLFRASPDTWHDKVFEFLRANGYPNLKVPPPSPSQAKSSNAEGK